MNNEVVDYLLPASAFAMFLSWARQTMNSMVLFPGLK